jgi:hypothetical protein
MTAMPTPNSAAFNEAISIELAVAQAGQQFSAAAFGRDATRLRATPRVVSTLTTM